MPKIAKPKRDGIYTRKGRKGYYAAWVDGTDKRVTRRLDATTMQEAIAELAEEKKRAAKLRAGEVSPVSKESFATFAAEFLETQRKRISSSVMRGKISAAEYERQRGIVQNHLIPRFGQMKLALIRKVHVTEYRLQRTGVVSDGTIIKEINTLKTLFSLAVELERIPATPAARAKLPPAPKGRVRWLNAADFDALIDACILRERDHRAESSIGWLNKKRRAEGLVEVALPQGKALPFAEQWLLHAAWLSGTLGTRRGELLRLTVSDIDLDRRVLLLRHTKSGEQRQAPLNELALSMLEKMGVRQRQERGNFGPLFPGVTPDRLSTEFVRACGRAGIADFSLHDLRHCFATWLIRKGASLYEVQKLLGHGDPRMTQRYAHLVEEHLAETSARLNGMLALPDIAAGIRGADAARTLPELAVAEGKPRK